MRAHVEQQIDLIARGKAEKLAVVAHTLHQFAQVTSRLKWHDMTLQWATMRHDLEKLHAAVLLHTFERKLPNEQHHPAEICLLHGAHQ